MTYARIADPSVVVDLYDSGLKAAAIARQVGVSRERVRQILVKRGLSGSNPLARRPDTCVVADCGLAIKGRGLCAKHYGRWRHHGTTDRLNAVAEHGSYSRYTYGCRCSLCRETNRVVQAKQQKARTERLKSDPTLAPHGRRSTYTMWGCRCRECTAAHSAMCAEYAQRRKAVMPPGTFTATLSDDWLADNP